MNLYQEKEILGDALGAEKSATNLFNTYSNECVHDKLRDTMLNILADEHSLQNDVFNTMHDMGYYPTPEAQQTKVEEARQRYSASYKAV